MVKNISGDIEHEGETLRRGEGVMYMLHNVFIRCFEHTDLYARHLSVLVVVDTYSRRAYMMSSEKKTLLNPEVRKKNPANFMKL